MSDPESEPAVSPKSPTPAPAPKPKEKEPKAKKPRKPRATPDVATQELILLLHLIIEQMKRGETGRNGGIDWQMIGDQFGTDENGDLNPEKSLHREAARTRFRKSYDEHMRGRWGVDAGADIDKVMPKAKGEKKGRKKKVVEKGVEKRMGDGDGEAVEKEKKGSRKRKASVLRGEEGDDEAYGSS